MSVRYPTPLSKGSTIGLICPAGGFDDYGPVVLVSRYLKRLGYKVKIGDTFVNPKKSFKYLSGEDEARLEDLNSFWFNKNVNAIFCL